MTTSRWIIVGALAAGIVLMAWSTPRAEKPERGKTGWQIYVCPAIANYDCYHYGKVLDGQTACSLDLASLAFVLPKATRLSCVQVNKETGQ